RVQVFHFQLGNVLSLLAAHASSHFFTGVAASFLNFEFVLNQVAHQRLLDNKRVRTVFKNGDRDGQYVTHLLCRHFVELLEELHHVDACLTQCWTDWWRRVTLPRRDVQLNDRGYLLCHVL